LVSYAVYVVQAARSSQIRGAIVQRALGVIEESIKKPEIEDLSEEELEPIEDPLEISKPWTPESQKGIKPVKTDE
jgi:hypothetical protein